VVHWQLLSPNVLEIGLKLPAIEPFRWQAGQSVDLILADGTRRAYSIASSPTGVAPLLLQVARVPGGHMSGALFALNGPGALLTMEGPYGGFADPSVPPGGSLVLVAGGTGYAPLRSLLLARFEQSIDVPVRLYFGARECADLYADAELRALAAQWPNFTYVPVCEQGAPRADVRHGRVTTVVREEETQLAQASVVAAGPTAMVAALAAELVARGLPKERFYADAFG
jgi:CDP-4-dehydro-6-deoxyglucose reductase